MKVTVLAYTTTAPAADEIMMSEFEDYAGDIVGELAGRSCYQAFHKPNDATRSNGDYLANILRLGHESVLEHSSVTFYITGISRSTSHEFVRHRHLSPSQQSQRYVDESQSTFIEPPLFSDPRIDGDVSMADSLARIRRVAVEAREAYADFVEDATALGIPRKQAREAARSILPNGTETRIVMTGNLRAWRHFIKMRHNVHADAEIRVMAKMILDHLRTIAPNSVQDITDEPGN